MNEGTVEFLYPDPQQGQNNYILTRYSSSGAFAKNAAGKATGSGQVWVMESVNYIVGDLDINGSINVKDATIIQKYVAGIGTLTNMGYVLADVTGDNIINVRDATYIQQHL